MIQYSKIKKNKNKKGQLKIRSGMSTGNACRIESAEFQNTYFAPNTYSYFTKNIRLGYVREGDPQNDQFGRGLLKMIT